MYLRLLFNFKFSKAGVAFLLLYIAVSATILLRASADKTGYTTPDSEYYLELAENLKSGKGFYMSNEYPIPSEKVSDNNVPFTAWPIGYPVLIFLTSYLTTLNVFWASKLLNILLLGLGFLLMRRINPTHAWMLACAYCSYTMLAIYTYTWSEAPFNLGCLFLVYLLSRLDVTHKTNQIVLLLFLTGIFLFLMRYVGIFSFGILALAAGYYWQRGQLQLSLKLVVVTTLLCLLASLYFCFNYYLTASFSGGDRLAGSETAEKFFIKQTTGIVNELFLIRKHYASGPPDLLFFLALTFQAIVIGIVAWLVKLDWPHLHFNRRQTLFPRLCLWVAGLYFAFVFFLRALSPFDPLDFRLLSPSVFLILIAALYFISILPERHTHKPFIKVLIAIFFLTSLLLNLPKQYILDGFRQLLF